MVEQVCLGQQTFYRSSPTTENGAPILGLHAGRFFLVFLQKASIFVCVIICVSSKDFIHAGQSSGEWISGGDYFS